METATTTSAATTIDSAVCSSIVPLKYGDQVVLYESVHSMKLITLVEGQQYSNKFGSFGHFEFIGRTYGEKVFNNKKSAFLYLLRPNPVLLTDTLAHKTQILYQADISMVIAKMNITPGSIVVESGTGSASLSSSIARTIQAEGHLYTFEFNEERAKNGIEVLKLQKLSNFDVIWRDVINNGFMPIEGEQAYGLTEHGADAVFLDLPRPYDTIQHAKQVLKHGGTLCCFSPCIEQVMRNCEEMRRHRFVQITTVEVLQRPFERRIQVYPSAFGPPTAVLNAKRTHAQFEAAQSQEASAASTNVEGSAEPNEEEEEEEAQQQSDDGEEVEAEGEEKKGKKQLGKAAKKAASKQENKIQAVVIPDYQPRRFRIPPVKIVYPTINKTVYSSGPKEIKGHTGYLTFAILM